MLGQLRVTFGLRAAALLERARDRLARAGRHPAPTPPVDPDARRRHAATSVATSRSPSPAGRLSSEDERVLNSFAAQVAAAAERERLQGEAGRAADLAAANTLRGIAAPGGVARPAHAAGLDQGIDLQPPASATSNGPRRTVDEFQRTIDEETDRLTHIVGNLLDMSRLQAGALHVQLRPTGVEEIVLAAVASLGRRITTS